MPSLIKVGYSKDARETYRLGLARRALARQRAAAISLIGQHS